MTQDLVTRLRDLQREIASTANGAHCYGVWAREIGSIIAALAAAPPADLVALVLEWQASVTDMDGETDIFAFDKRLTKAREALLAWRPSAPPEPDHATPQDTE